MTKREKELVSFIDDLLWMAARYAHGRHTYAPAVIRDVIDHMRSIYPEWRPKRDLMIKPRQPDESGFDSDYLDDIFNPEGL